MIRAGRDGGGKQEGAPLPQEALPAAGGFARLDQIWILTVGTTVTHDAVFHDVSGALRVFIDHARRDNFANIRNFTHGDNFLNIRVRTVSVRFHRSGVAGNVGWNLVSHGGCTQAAEGQND